MIMLNYVYRWWKDLNFSRELPFIRDRVVECYFWILGAYFEPEYLLARKITTKVIVMTSTIDDIYDVYGTLEELELFSDAIERLTLTHFLILYSSLCYITWKSQFTRVYLLYRWDIDAIDQLPEYMKMCYRALLDVYSEMDQKIGEGRSYRTRYAREAVSNIIHTNLEDYSQPKQRLIFSPLKKEREKRKFLSVVILI